jgi:anti-sigma regulatory factor (Ser/Thr protein kinase)
MREITLHLLDITENSVSAGAKTIQIEISEDMENDLLTVSVEDDGRGMDADTVARITDPFTTSRKERNVGLGIPLFKEAAEFANGQFQIQSTPGIGTKVAAEFQHSHIDRMPLGDVTGTFLSFIIAHPEIHWVLRYTYRPQQGQPATFEFDDQPIKETLGEVPLCTPEVITFLRETLQEGIANCKSL